MLEKKDLAAAKQEAKDRKRRKGEIVQYAGMEISMERFSQIVVKHYWQLFHTDVTTGEKLPLLSFKEAKHYVRERFPKLYHDCYINFDCKKELRMAQTAGSAW